MMEETKKKDAPKTSWFTGLKAEFQKIVWLDKKITWETDCSSLDCFRYPGCDYCGAGSWYPVWC